jgi:putative membrane protein
MKQLVLIFALAAITSASPAAFAATPRTLDAQWLQTSMANDRFEIMAGKLAARRSSNGHLSALAGRIISDHTKSLKAAMALARRKDIAVPAVPTPIMQWHLHILESLPASRFEREYITFQIRAHEENIVLAGSEVEFGTDKAIRKFADAESNALSKHLRLARQTLRASD